VLSDEAREGTGSSSDNEDDGEIVSPDSPVPLVFSSSDVSPNDISSGSDFPDAASEASSDASLDASSDDSCGSDEGQQHHPGPWRRSKCAKASAKQRRNPESSGEIKTVMYNIATQNQSAG
jgi:hypothetical protein